MRLALVTVGTLLAAACSSAEGGTSGGLDGGEPSGDASSTLPDATPWPSGGSGGGPPDAAADSPDPPDPPVPVDPCPGDLCWDAPALTSACGEWTLNENFSTGLYNVHAFPLTAPAGVELDVTATRTGGAWSPALILHDDQGQTLHDGERSLSTAGLTVEPLATGRTGDEASVRIQAQNDTHLSVFLTGWDVIDNAFGPLLPMDATYSLSVATDCQLPDLLSPPNFDPNDIVGGYHLLPDSEPPGLYTRKADDCSRGTKLLIDVLYTVALKFNQVRPSLSPIAFRDLNEGSCSTVDHQTHDDGTHADVVAGCATQVACADNQPAIDLARLFVDTGQVCGILNNDVDVQNDVNAYFASKFSYEPWNGKFMRTVSGHTSHFHVRVKKPDGTCN